MGKKFGRTAPPRPPAGPPASAKEGAAAVIKAAVKLFNRQDGNGVDKRLLAEILFHAALKRSIRSSKRTGEKSSPVASTSGPITGSSATRTATISAQVTPGRAGAI
jgi:hypothetical protein